MSPQRMTIHMWFGSQSQHYHDVSCVYVPSMCGMIGILADHCSMVSVLAPGMMVVWQDTSGEHEYPISGGLMAVHDNTVTIWTASHNSLAPSK